MQQPISVELARKVLSEDGLEVSLDEVKQIVEFMRKLAKITVEHYIIKR